MRSALLDIRAQKQGSGGISLMPILILWGVVVAVILGFIWFNSDIGESYGNFYLLPWALLTGVVVLAPTVYLWQTGRFDPFHPLTFAAWSYIFPAFVIGAVIISFDWVDWYFMSFIDDPAYSLPLTLVYISLGYLGLTFGYFMPVGRWGANRMTRLLPQWNWEPREIWLPGLLLLAFGVGFNLLGFIQGLLGYQRNLETGAFDGLLSFLFIVLTAGNVLLWLGIFSAKEKTGMYWLVLLILLLLIPLRMSLLGSRSSLVLSLFPIAFAFVYSGRKLRWHVAAMFGVVALAAVFIGVAYGTTFRNIKGSEARMNAGDYFGQVTATVDYLLDEDPVLIVEESARALAHRVENLSSVATVVSNYEKLAPYEASYGLENNILNDLYTSFIPRFVWSDKPNTSDARAYSDLYFNYPDNSFAISPFADLLRNFGVVGIPIGMALLGIYLRFIYSSLITTQYPSIWKKAVYFLLLTVVTYESFYAILFPSIVRTIFIAAVCVLLIRVISGRASRTELRA